MSNLLVECFDPSCSVGPMVGLFLISIGTGGIKPCVVTFGGDQFPEKQVGCVGAWVCMDTCVGGCGLKIPGEGGGGNMY